MPKETTVSCGRFPLWKKLCLGTGARSPEEIINAVECAGRFGCWISDGAREMLQNPKFTVVKRATEVELTIISPVELALVDDLSFGAIVNCALSAGLALCPAEAGPQLLLQHGEQLSGGDMLHVASAPIDDARGYPRIFVLNGRVGLASSGGRPNNSYRRRDAFIFAS